MLEEFTYRIFRSFFHSHILPGISPDVATQILSKTSQTNCRSFFQIFPWIFSRDSFINASKDSSGFLPDFFLNSSRDILSSAPWNYFLHLSSGSPSGIFLLISFFFPPEIILEILLNIFPKFWTFILKIGQDFPLWHLWNSYRKFSGDFHRKLLQRFFYPP